MDQGDRGFEAYKKTKTFGSLNGIRFLSIVAVLFHHTVGGLVSWPFFSRGFLGVDMFFVLSGFLIVTLMLREQEKTGSISIPKFYGRRVLRIFPPYFLLLGFLALEYLTVAQTSPLAQPFFSAIPFTLTFTANWVKLTGAIAILWSLSTEEQFYLVWPMVQKYLGPRKVVVFLFLVIGVNQLLNFQVFDNEMKNFLGIGHDDLNILQATFTPIALGALAANVLHRRRGFRFLSSATGFPGASLVWLGLTGGLMSFPASDISGLLRLLIQVSMTLFLVSCVVQEDHLLRPVLAWGPVRRLGQVSYGVYLYHIVAMAVVTLVVSKVGMDLPGVVFLGTVAFAWLIAEVSYRFWEAPFLRIKERRLSKT